MCISIAERLRAIRKSSGFYTVAGLAGLFSARAVVGFAKNIITETGKAEGQLAQLRAALESTGEAAGFNQLQLTKMAQQMAAATTLSSGDIVEAQTRLLSYSGIVGE